MRQLTKNKQASAVPILLFFATIISVGALYTLFFIEVGIPQLSYMIPLSDYKTFFMMLIYAIPLFVLIVGIISLLIAGLKKTAAFPPYYGGMR